MPAGHVVFKDDPVGQFLPAAQAVANVEDEDPPGQQYPAWQSPLDALFPVPLQYFPVKHGFQSVEAAPINSSLYAPAGHEVGVPVALGQSFPVEHGPYLWSASTAVDESVQGIWEKS